MKNPYLVLEERGFLKRETHHTENIVEKLFTKERVTCYAGYDGTASSLHVGNLLTIMALSHIRLCGHRPIALIGGGTTMVGDPSGKTELRKMLKKEQIVANGKVIQKQIAHYLGEDGVIYDNNIHWLGEFSLIDFLREAGSRFTIAEMLTTEAYKSRLQSGLTFLEFSYQLFQAYDFLHLYRTYGCKIQLGGDDQWGNICAGVDLVRKLESVQVEGLTIPLLETASGSKMGKTEKGAIWLDGKQTSPYDFYQFWINTDDLDVEKFLKLYTYLPLDEISTLTSVSGAELRNAKEVLAYEATKITHGEEEANQSKKASKALFYGKGSSKEGIPTHKVEKIKVEEGLSVLDAFFEGGLVKSKSEIRRKIKEGGAYVKGERVSSHDLILTVTDLDEDGEIMLRLGKKKYLRLVVG